MYVYSPYIPVGSAGFPLITPRYLNSLFHTLIWLGRLRRTFLQMAICAVPIFVPLGTHYCWVYIVGWIQLNDWCFVPRFCTMNHAPGAGSIARPVGQQSRALPLYHGCLPMYKTSVKVYIPCWIVQGSSARPETTKKSFRNIILSKWARFFLDI